MAWYDITFYELFPQVFNMSITGTLIILAVICVRFLVKKAPKIFSYALWAVVLFRLLCPVSFTLDISFLNQFDVPVTESGSIEYVPSNIVHMAEPSISTPISAVNDVVNERLPQGDEQLVADPLEAPVSIITYFWFFGIAALVIYSAVQYVKLRRKLIGATPLRGNIFLADYIDLPFVMGLVFPKIYLPSSLSETEQEYVILHEMYHVKRGDHIIKILAFAALCMHWFNPFVWLAFVLSAKDMEMSCDEAVMRRMDHDIRVEYSESLLRFATGKRVLLGTPLAFGESDTKARVKNVMNYRRPLIWVSVVAGMILITAVVLLITNPEHKSTELFGANYLELPDEAVRLDTEELTFFNESFFSAPYMSILSMTNIFLNTDYSAPEEIDLSILFNSSLMALGRNAMSTEERETVKEYFHVDENPDVSIGKLATSEMNYMLDRYMGLTLEETKKNGIENFLYLEEYDAYYLAGYEAPTYRSCYILDGYRTKDGLVVLLYEDQSQEYSGKSMKYLVTLQVADETARSLYYFVSNLPYHK